MSKAAEIRQALQRAVLPAVPPSGRLVSGRVVSYDDAAQTLDVEPADGGPDWLGVRLRATEGDGDHFMVVPSVGSEVLIAQLDGNMAVLALVADPERVSVRIGGTSAVVDASGVRLGGDAFGGIVKAEEVAARLNDLVQQVNQLKQLLAAWVPAPGDGGTALKAVLTPFFSQPLGAVNPSTLQNNHIQHGSE